MGNAQCRAAEGPLAWTKREEEWVLASLEQSVCADPEGTFYSTAHQLIAFFAFGTIARVLRSGLSSAFCRKAFPFMSSKNYRLFCQYMLY
jgi:hypothetical protein